MVSGRPPVDAVVKAFGLQPHPEGGFFAETFRDDTIRLSADQLPQDAGFKVGRAISTAIYFLIPTANVSHLHRIPSQEVWHFYMGDPLTVLQLDDATGQVTRTVLGLDISAGQVPQHVVPGGVWFGAYPTLDYDRAGEKCIAGERADGEVSTRYTLVGCTVAPAFEFADFELAKRDYLLAKHPQAATSIVALTTE